MDKPTYRLEFALITESDETPHYHLIVKGITLEEARECMMAAAKLNQESQ